MACSPRFPYVRAETMSNSNSTTCTGRTGTRRRTCILTIGISLQLCSSFQPHLHRTRSHRHIAARRTAGNDRHRKSYGRRMPALVDLLTISSTSRRHATRYIRSSSSRSEDVICHGTAEQVQVRTLLSRSSTSRARSNTSYRRCTSSGSISMVSDAERQEQDQHRRQYHDDSGSKGNEISVLGTDSPSFGFETNGDFADDTHDVDRYKGDDYSGSDRDGDDDSPQQPVPYTDMAHRERLRLNTDELLDEDIIPIGDLTSDDVSAIAGLMSAWARTKTRRGALTVEKLLKRIVDDINAGNMEVKVTTRMYTMSIDAWSKVGGLQAAKRAQDIHDTLVRMSLATGDELIAPSTISYNALLNAWSKSRSSEARVRAETILKEVIQSYHSGNNSVKPDVVSFTSVIDTLAKSEERGSGQRGLQLLEEMERMASSEEGDDSSLRPNVFSYSACINAFAKSPDEDAPERAEELLTRMKDKYNKGDWRLRPTVVMYNSIINAYGRSGSAKKATMILDRLEKSVEEGGEEVEPDALSWSLAVAAWAYSADPGALERSEEMLLRMERWARATMRKLEKEGALPHHGICLDIDAYNAVLFSLSRSQKHDAPRRALAILNRMIDLANAGFNDVRPNAKSWNYALNTFSRTREAGIAAKAEAVLMFMIREGVKPDLYSWAAVLNAYQRNSEPGSAARADSIVRHMQRLYLAGDIDQGPDVYHFTIICNCWAKSRERIAARRCKQILDYMLQQSKAGNKSCSPNVRTYNSVIDAHARSKDVEEAEALLDYLISACEKDSTLTPDSFSFQSVINAWTRSRRRDSGKRAEMVLEKLLMFHRDHSEMIMNARSFSHIISSYSRNNQLECAIRAESLLNRMIELYEEGFDSLAPTSVVFTDVINAYANSKQPCAGKCAERVQRSMIELSERQKLTSLRPNTVISNAVIAAWAGSGVDNAGERAESILDSMERNYDSGNNEMKPDSRSYVGVLAAWGKSRVAGKAQNSHAILRRMVLQYEKQGNESCRPNAQVYTALINAAAFTNGSEKEQREAFDLAKSTLDELYDCKYDEPTSAAIGTFMKACGRLKIPRDVASENLAVSFNKCRELGLVNDFILTQLRYSSPDGLYRRLLGNLIPSDGPEKVRVEVEKIPPEWRRNIPER